jgi:hypothetical protein
MLWERPAEQPYMHHRPRDIPFRRATKMAHTFATSDATQASFQRPRRGRLGTTLLSVLDALWEGFAAHREYEHLRSRGIAHDAALRHAFGITQADLLQSKKPQEEAMDDQKYIEKAKLNPASEFKRPMNVVAASDIATAEKLAILRAWEADERALQRAEDEGMGGGEHAHLHRVQEALARLGDRGCTH